MTTGFGIRKNKSNGLTQILLDKRHVAWLNTGGAISRWHRQHSDWQVMLNHLCLKPGHRPNYIFFQAMPSVMDFAGVRNTVNIRATDKQVEIETVSAEPTGHMRSRALMVFERDPRRSGQIRARYTINVELIKDLDARRLVAGKEPLNRIMLREVDGLGPCWIFEMCDPWPDSLRGPATQITRDYPYRIPISAEDSFTRGWKKRFNVYACETSDGSIKTLPMSFEKLDRIPARYFQILKNGGRGGYFSNPEGNPTIKIESSDLIGTGICHWIYDQHIFVIVPIGTPQRLWNMSNRFRHFNILPEQVAGKNAVLKAGRRIDFKATVELLSRAEGEKFVRHATPLSMPEYENVYHHGLPAFVHGHNDFTIPAATLPDCNAWKPAIETVWDRDIGYRTPGSLRINDDQGIGEGGWMVTSGRSFFCEPIRPGVKYLLSGRIKTVYARGEGAWLEVLVKQYDFGAKGGERVKMVFRAETKKIEGDAHWALVTVEMGPFPENCTIVQLFAKFRGPGTAWFDDIAFLPQSR